MPACTSTSTMESPAAGLPVVLLVTVLVTVEAWAAAMQREPRATARSAFRFDFMVVVSSWFFRFWLRERKTNRRSFDSPFASLRVAQDDSRNRHQGTRLEDYACCKCSISARSSAASFSSSVRWERKSSSGYLPALY